MSNWKRFIALGLSAMMMSAALAGCGSTDSSTAEGGESADAGKTLTLCLSTRDEWLSTLADAAIAEGEALGYEVIVQDCQNDVNKQLQYVETVRNSGAEVVIVNLVNYELAQEVIDAAGDMSVVFVNRMPTDPSLMDANHVYVGSDEGEAGYLQSEYLANYFKEKGQTDVSYILLSGDLGMPSTIKRTEYAIQGLKDAGLNATAATADLVCEWSREVAVDRLAPVLTQGVEFDCIIANNDAMALGAVEALEAAGIDPSSLPIVGIDATVDALEAIESGTMAMSAFQNADGQGSNAVRAAVNLIEGKPFNEGGDFELAADNEFAMYVPFEAVTRDNVADYQ